MYKKLIKNMSLITIGTLASKIIVYLMIPLYTSVLTTEEYGEVDLIFTTVSLLLPLLSLEISNALMRFLLDENYDNNIIFSCCFIILIGGIGLFFCLLPLFLEISIFSKYFVYFIMYYLINLVNGFLQSMARGINLIKSYSIAGILQTLFTVLFNILLLVVIDWKITGYLLAYSIGGVTSSIFLMIAILKNIDFKIKKKFITKHIIKELLIYSIPLIPNSLLWWISNSSDKYILTMYRGVSDVGIYSVAYKIPTILTVLSSIFITAWQISSVDNFGSDENKHFFRDVFQKYFYFTVILSMGILLFLKVLCKFMFINDFYIAWKIVPLLLLGFIYYNMSIFLGSIYTAAKKTKMVMISTLIGAILNIILNFMFIPKTGMYGAAIATTISYIVIYLMRKKDSKKILDLKIGNIDFIYGVVVMLQMIAVYNDSLKLNILCVVTIFILFVRIKKRKIK